MPLKKLLALALLPAGSLHAQAVKLEVIYPEDGAVISSQKYITCFGNVTPRTARVWIPDAKLKRYKDGVFVARVPVQPGSFSFPVFARSQDTVSVVKTVFIRPGYFETNAGKLSIDSSLVWPEEDISAGADQAIPLLVKGTVGSRAFYSIGDAHSWSPLKALERRKQPEWGDAVFAEGIKPGLPAVNGLFWGVMEKMWRYQSTDELTISYALVAGTDTVYHRAPGRIRSREFPVSAMMIENSESVSREEKSFYTTYFSPRTAVKLLASAGGYYKVDLGNKEHAWLRQQSVIRVSSEEPTTRTQQINLTSRETETELSLQFLFEGRVPYRIQYQSNTALRLLLFTPSHKNYYLPPLTIETPGYEIKNVESNKGTIAVDVVSLQKSIWGFEAYYEKDSLKISINKPPQIANPARPLKGRTICLDAGHKPDTGSIGPRGRGEDEITGVYVAALQGLLEREGARVIVTHNNEMGANLASRRILAQLEKPDIFLSIHFNALPAAVNPFRNRGSSTYYYHPHSRLLAETVHKAYTRRTGLRHFGTHYGNYHICRLTRAPAVLLEPAFITNPIEENKIFDPQFQKRLCRGIVEGLKLFFKRVR